MASKDDSLSAWRCPKCGQVVRVTGAAQAVYCPCGGRTMPAMEPVDEEERNAQSQ